MGDLRMRAITLLAIASTVVLSMPASSGAGEFSASSTSFSDGGKIPAVYTCKGRDVSVQLSWHDAPPGARSFAIIMDDPDAQSVAGYTWVHWNVFNVPAAVMSIAEGGEISEALIGRTHFGRHRYNGPCPPRGSHRYVIAVYALDTVVAETFGQDPHTRSRFEDAMSVHILAKAEISGTFP